MASVERRRVIALVLFCLLYFLLALHSERWLLRETDGRLADDFGIYYQAYLRARAGGNPYAPYKIGLSFIYHPFALTWISLFNWHSIRTAAILWMAAGSLAWVAALGLALHLLVEYGPSRGRPSPHSAQIILAILMMVAFAPLGESIHVGQINGFVAFCLVMTLYGSERPGLAWEIATALALGLAVVLKTSPLVLMIYFLVLRRYRLLFLFIASLAVLSLVTAIQFSPTLVFQFGATVLRIGSAIHYSRYNQSILRLVWQVLRTLGISSIDGWLVRMSQAASALLFILTSATAWPTVIPYTPDRIVLFNLLLSLMVASSPIVWYHHSTLLLMPILSLLLHRERRVRWLGMAAIMLIQSERALESAGIASGPWAGAPALAGQMLILFIYIILYVRARWPLCTIVQSGLALWRRYSGGV